jgi:hypothetical protein
MSSNIFKSHDSLDSLDALGAKLLELEEVRKACNGEQK